MVKGRNNSYLQERKIQETPQELQTNQPFKLPRKATGTYHKYNTDGYRKHRSTEDQLALLAQEIENAFQQKKNTVAVFYDLSKAFDKVWRDGLLQACVSGRVYKWIRCFLHDRSARVKVDGHLSDSVKIPTPSMQTTSTVFSLHNKRTS